MPITSPAQRKATDKYIKNSLDEIKIRVPKGRKAIIAAQAEAQGESLNSYVSKAIDERMARLEGVQEEGKHD
jgi:predicted HicB family RNase H-like nuclease